MSEQINNTGIRIYNTGGAGIGVGKYFEGARGKHEDGIADLFPVYIDASTASTFGVPEDHFYQLPGSIGSGGVRKFNAPEIVRHTGEILQKFPPMETNVIIHSSTGGSGSVMGPSIVSELLAQRKNVIIYAISSDDTLNYIENSIGTVESYASICELRETGVVLNLLQNGIDGKVEDIDRMVRRDVACLTSLFSGNNKNLDARDLYNFLHFSDVTTFAPQVASLSVHRGKVVVENDSSIITVATLNKDLDDTRLDYPVEFQRVGVPMSEDFQQDGLAWPLHFVITDGYLDKIMKKLRKQKADFELKASARVVRNNLSDGSKKALPNGLVF